MECLVLPLQDKLEEWKKLVVNLDKEHSKGNASRKNRWLSNQRVTKPVLIAEYKKVRADIKKRTTEAQRWQKKAKKIRSAAATAAASGGAASGIGGNALLMQAANERTLNAANQELLRAADAAQVDLNSRLALLHVNATLPLPFSVSVSVSFSFSFSSSSMKSMTGWLLTRTVWLMNRLNDYCTGDGEERFALGADWGTQPLLPLRCLPQTRHGNSALQLL